jgi:hypothetical protein
LSLFFYEIVRWLIYWKIGEKIGFPQKRAFSAWVAWGNLKKGNKIQQLIVKNVHPVTISSKNTSADYFALDMPFLPVYNINHLYPLPLYFGGFYGQLQTFQSRRVVA